MSDFIEVRIVGDTVRRQFRIVNGDFQLENSYPCNNCKHAITITPDKINSLITKL
ncbi:hypothetical protein XNC1_3262 [Xenorhabdus nematophila ATCC 19061]|uniref:Uncharacterized protein n=1 Tax=Xenorhabdus nematophila (strain ATCC 19061 / DSM 3370 / CCUG 14189 / LMG 1036 / NCIMB 9965 / AN6) TaxID=406817 RepID=D3VLI8_XENNA|nr:hypothetical protein XNC1_3262 [Xenorhabdus nematophila ATCC 19061]CEK24133.1 hypothetical protein XNC2_3139 [Xenorhabdus nematophila AN6/1]